MPIKSIRFRGEITSNGIVNFDDERAKWQLIKDPRYSFDPKFKNYKFAKHSFTQSGIDEKGKAIFHAVLKISRDCIRQAIFKDDQPFHNPHIFHAEEILIKLLSSAAGLLRGYLFADLGIKKKSSVFISDAVQISDNVSTIDVGTMSGPKDKKADTNDDSGLSLHYKESIGGKVVYEFQGALDLDELQFWASLFPMFHHWAGNADFVARVLTELFGYECEIVENVKTEYEIPKEIRYSLSSKSGRLGIDTVIGRSFSECDTACELILSNVKFEDIPNFLPGGSKRKKLEDIIGFCMPSNIECRIKIIGEKQGMKIGTEARVAYLGHSSYV